MFEAARVEMVKSKPATAENGGQLLPLYARPDAAQVVATTACAGVATHVGASEKVPAPVVTAVVPLNCQLAMVVPDPTAGVIMLCAPATHTVHTAGVLAAPTLLYMPAVHPVQANVPVVRALYAPKGQAVHPKVPIVSALKAPEGQAVHPEDVRAPVNPLYVPTRHAVQVVVPVVSALYAPARQEVHPEVPVVNALYSPATHAVHPAEELAIAKAPYAPAVHAVHADAPVESALYAPAKQPVHAE